MPGWAENFIAKQQANQRRLAEIHLAVATKSWTVPLLMRHYDSGGKGDAQFQTEAELLLEHGYEFETQSEAGSHLHAGRLLLTGGLSIFAGRGGIRSKGKITVTYRLGAEPG